MTCTTVVCGTGKGTGPEPGDPSNDSVIGAHTSEGGITASWSYPTVNPQNVAYFKVYRCASSNYAGAIQIGSVSGSQFFDAISVTADTVYYYWIQIVSIHGTVGTAIGPASATAKKRDDQIIEIINRRIDDGVLSVALQEKIANIIALSKAIYDEANERLLSNVKLKALIDLLDSKVITAFTLIDQEIEERTTADSAFVSQVNIWAAGIKDNLAALMHEITIYVDKVNSLARDTTTIILAMGGREALIQQDKLAWLTADTALLKQIATLYASDEDVAAALRNVYSIHIGYAAKIIVNSSGTITRPFDGDGVFELYPIGTYPSDKYPQYVYNRRTIIDKIGVDNWNSSTLHPNRAFDVTWVPGMPLATAIKTVQVKGPDGNMTGIEQAFEAQADIDGKLTSMYTVRIDTDTDGTHYIGGFGLFGNADKIEAGFDVDTFWIGKIGKYKNKPFILEGDTVYIENAVIKNLNTGNIAGNAVTTPINFFSAANSGNYGSAGTVLQTGNINSMGAPLFIFGCYNSVGDGNCTGIITVITRNDVEIYRSESSSTYESNHTGMAVFCDTPGNILANYKMHSFAKGGLCTATNRSLLILEIKR